MHARAGQGGHAIKHLDTQRAVLYPDIAPDRSTRARTVNLWPAHIAV